MIVLLDDGEMTQASPDGHHNIHKVRQLQNKLLEADEKTAIESLKSVYRKNAKLTTAQNGTDPMCYEITGWIPKKINFRKADREGEKGKDGSKDKDSRPRASHNDRYDNFVFSHYRDPKKYILQYREQHSYIDPLSTAAKKRLYGNNYIPPQQTENPSPIQRISTQYNFHYTRRESQKISKVKRDESSPSDSNTTDANTGTELDSYRDKQKCVGSKSSRTEKSDGSSTNVNRVTVPAPLTLSQPVVGVKQIIPICNGSQAPNLKPECQQIGPRTLDTLACIADEKQQNLNDIEQATSEDSDHSEVISIGRLSTTCLSADVSVKVGPKLEPSCTYHVYPSDLLITKNQQIVPNSMMWNPAKSSLEFKKKKDSDRKANEAGMNSPFKISKDSNGLRAKLANHENEYLHQLKIQQPKEFIVTRTNEFPPLATQNRCLVHSNSLLAETEDEDDLPHSIFFQVHGISSKTNTIKTKAELEDRTNYHLEELKKYDAKTVLMLHKHGRSAPPEVTRITSAGSGSRDASNTVTSDAAPSRPTTDDVYAFTAGQQPQHRQKPRGTPYFKFWNHNGNHGKTGTNANRRAKWCTDMNLKHLAELVLAEQDAQNPELCHMNNTLNHGPSIASGSLTPKSVDSLTWREQLDALRQIRPRLKSKHRNARLFFFKEDRAFEVQGNNDCFCVEKCPGEFDPMDKEQVSQQRRIRHLVEQAKLKCAAKFSDNSYPAIGKDKTLNITLKQMESTNTNSTTDTNSESSAKISPNSDAKTNSGVAKVADKETKVMKHCPSLIWRLPQYQFSCTTLSHPPRSHTCVPTDRRL